MKKIMINVECRETIEYNQDIEVTEDQYKKLKSIKSIDVSCRRNPVQYDILKEIIDPLDVFSGGSEFIDLQIKEI